MSKLLIATTNTNKLKEIQSFLNGISYDLISLNDISLNITVKESGKTFEENAIIKAKAYGEASNLLTLSEDSGLEIDVLDGRPGIYSARYVEGSDRDRMNQILKELEGIPFAKRTARYHEVIALYNPIDKEIKTFQGMTEGIIIDKPKGINGFGYDPIFYSTDLKKTFAEASLLEKNQVSHRGKALVEVKKYLTEAHLSSVNSLQRSDL